MKSLIAALLLLSAGLVQAAPPKKQVQIEGQVVDEQGSPVAGVKVLAIVRKAPAEVHSQKDGSFSLTLTEDSIPGAIFIAREDGDGRQAYFTTGYPGDKKIPAVRLVLKKAREIKVSVVDQDQRPIAGAKVAAGEYRKVAEASTDAQGKGVLRVPADAPIYGVFASAPGRGADYAIFRQPSDRGSDPYRLTADHQGEIVLTLTPSKSIKVRVVDNKQQPLAGAVIHAWYFERAKKGGGLNTSGFEEFFVTTDKSGEAIFTNLPADMVKPVTFWVQLDGYASAKRHTYDPAKGNTKIVAELATMVPVRGRVVLAGGKPAGGALVQASGAGYQFDSFSGQTTTDDRGSFDLMVNPDQFAGFLATSGKQMSFVETRVIRADQPVEAILLTLQPGVRVFGKLTTGADQVPSAGKSIGLVWHDDYRYYKLPKDQQLPNPTDSRRGISPRFAFNAVADSAGNYEFFAARGSYQLQPYNGADIKQIEIGDQPVEANLNAAVTETQLTGRVVLKSDPQKGVAEAKVLGRGTTQDSAFLDLVAGDGGKFEAVRKPVPMLVHAKSADGSLSGIVTLQSDAKVLEIPIGPSASAAGRLIDADEGTPLAKRRIDYGVRIDLGGSLHTYAFGGSTTTDEQGEFVISGLTVGSKWNLQGVVEFDGEGHPRAWIDAHSFTPEKAGTIQLGDVQMQLPETPTKRLKRSMASTKSPEERLQAKLLDAQAAEQHVLLVAGSQASANCLAFFELYHDFNDKLGTESLREELANFALLAVDASEGEALKSLQPLLGRLKLKGPEKDDALLAIVGRDGTVVAESTAKAFLKNGKLDPAQLAAFFKSHAPVMPDAEVLYANALAQAKREHKRVFVQHSGAYCGPCVRLSRFMHEQEKIWSKDFIYLKLDRRFQNGEKVINEIRKEPGGIPWVVIQDEDGKPLVTSNGPKGNIGCPSSPAGIAYFRLMLRTTARNLSDEELDTMLGPLAARAE